MPWSNKGGGWQGGGGGDGDGGGPWGQGGGGQQPPDLEEILRRGQDNLKKFMPGGGGSGKIVVLIGLVLVALWASSGIYKVGADEQGVVMRFGEYDGLPKPPGLHYHLPSPIETALTPKVTRINRIDVGYRTSGDTGRTTARRDVSEESLMLTGDENIVDIDFAVFWRIKDAGQYLFNIDNPEATVKATAESAMREIIGKTNIAAAFAEGRQKIEQSTLELLQKVLDGYSSGIQVTEVKLQKVDPPAAVIDSFRDVQRAKADAERLRNEAEGYSNDILPRARGEAEQMIQEASAYKAEVVARAEGDANRFLAVYNEFVQAKDITTKRLYLETMEEVLRGMTKIVIDGKGGQGVVPYLPLPELKKRSQ
ncbi:MAG: FtsH protease activity modulator HflK [Alphaproteobacteria bacterium]|jgi:modulator of FtsH protease HflK|nr:FtsH protease activity modulator HflK [Alphaproteobacteria bacterium]MBT4966460.1 FtsH protease activity modulator HflK [Alphaproteobacteria bacterium]MBT5158510.1 FtsH protease activity modulator HflK [Alphaproteobacteria bacterium]MBT6385385.1 FtsH protease activity modulator HflK [Alphaproteobacteria bacterium]